MLKRVYISGPITGIANRKDKFNFAENDSFLLDTK